LNYCLIIARLSAAPVLTSVETSPWHGES